MGQQLVQPRLVGQVGAALAHDARPVRAIGRREARGGGWGGGGVYYLITCSHAEPLVTTLVTGTVGRTPLCRHRCTLVTNIISTRGEVCARGYSLFYLGMLSVHTVLRGTWPLTYARSPTSTAG
jgi:hypothetical protein